MRQIFHPLEPKLRFAPPARLPSKSVWNEQVPFAMRLFESAQPRVIGEPLLRRQEMPGPPQNSNGGN